MPPCTPLRLQHGKTALDYADGDASERTDPQGCSLHWPPLTPLPHATGMMHHCCYGGCAAVWREEGRRADPSRSLLLFY